MIKFTIHFVIYVKGHFAIFLQKSKKLRKLVKLFEISWEEEEHNGSRTCFDSCVHVGYIY